MFTILTEQDHSNSPAYLQTPLQIAEFEILLDSLYETVNKEEGYEASLADLNYDCKNFEDRGLSLKFSGYSNTLIKFAETFITTMLTHANN